METRGFTVVRSGKYAHDIEGEAALVDNMHLAHVAGRLGQDRDAFVKHLTLCVRPSRSRHFPDVDLIDSPGLVDGNVAYPFDVNAVMREMSTSIADLVLVFFDPIGQALCSRTMAVVKTLNAPPPEGCPDKMRYFLTKADTVPRSQDRSKVLVQVATAIGGLLSRHGIDVAVMWIPPEGGFVHGAPSPAVVPPSAVSGTNAGTNPALGSSAAVAASSSSAAEGLENSNALPQLCGDIGKAVAQKVQRNMSDAQRDCDRLIAHIDRVLEEEDAKAVAIARLRVYVACLLPLFAVLGTLSFLDLLSGIETALPGPLRAADWYKALMESARPVLAVAVGLAELCGGDSLQRRLLAVAVAILVLSSAVQALRWRIRSLAARPRKEIAALRSAQSVAETMRKRVVDRREEYVRISQTPEYAGGKKQ